MRNALIGMGLLLVAGAGAWLGVESLASNRVAQLLADQPSLQAAAVQPLRDPRAIGIRLVEPRIADPMAELSLPWAQLSLSPLSPLTARLTLPDQGQLTLQGRSSELGMTEALASLQLAPLNRLAPSHLSVTADSVTLDGADLMRGLALDVRLARLDGDAPRAARVAYDATARIEALHGAVLAAAGWDLGPLPDPLGLRGPVRLWLDGTPSVTGGPAPLLVGWQTGGLDLGAGPVTLRVVGRVWRGDQGRAEGQVVVYSRDADAMLDLAEGLGLIPGQARLLVRAGLAQLSQRPLEAVAAGPDYPDPAEGELRLAVQFRDGQTLLGGVPVGPAPAF